MLFHCLFGLALFICGRFPDHFGPRRFFTFPSLSFIKDLLFAASVTYILTFSNYGRYRYCSAAATEENKRSHFPDQTYIHNSVEKTEEEGSLLGTYITS